MGFALLGSVTGIGGGTICDILLGADPVFWVKQPAYLVTCVVVSVITFFIAHIPNRGSERFCGSMRQDWPWFSVTGADSALAHGAGPTIAVAMGISTATFGGIIRDILGGESPVILKQEIYITAALLGSFVFVSLESLGLSRDVSAVSAILAAFTLRAAALHWNLSLPRYRSRLGKTDRP